MQKPLKTLVKLSKSELDRKRRELAEFLNRKEQKIREIKNLNDSLESERDNLNQNPEAAMVFASFLGAIRKKQTDIVEDIEKKLEPQIKKLSDEIADKFVEMKKYEVLLERKLAEAQAELNKKTQNTLDEVAMTQFGLKDNKHN
jgi:flagellar protein FliJ